MYSARHQGVWDSWKWETLGATEEKLLVLRLTSWSFHVAANGSWVQTRGGKVPRQYQKTVCLCLKCFQAWWGVCSARYSFSLDHLVPGGATGGPHLPLGPGLVPYFGRAQLSVVPLRFSSLPSLRIILAFSMLQPLDM